MSKLPRVSRPLERLAMQGAQADVVLHVRRLLRAPQEMVFAAMTRADMMSRWMCPESFILSAVHSDPRTGGSFGIEMRSPEGVTYKAAGIYLELRPHELLIYTWTWAEGHTMPNIETVVRVELSPRGAETLMEMTHSGLTSEEERAAHETGWNGAFDKLEALLDEHRA
ncbi:SRPBCC family protein [Neomesorhizobium albiziae]|nr:SRPBCC domain-containing protein [Mesorhizobium albiziae]